MFSSIYKNIFFFFCLGENSTLIYSLLDYTQYFSINSLTGQIDVIKSIDREELSYIQLHTIVSDQGFRIQYQSICTTIHININDINDHSPQFSSNNYIFNLFSDMPRYTIFGQIDAFDNDKNDQLIYTVEPNPYVTINMYTGHLRLKHYLYRLTGQLLNVTVQVSDGFHQNQTSIYIYIKSYPLAQQPILLSEPAFRLTINESLQVNQTIINIFHRYGIQSLTIDFIEIIDNKRNLPFAIDQQGMMLYLFFLFLSRYFQLKKDLRNSRFIFAFNRIITYFVSFHMIFCM